MDERRLQIFRAVAELHNFSRAADQLHLSQPTVSQQVQGLEEHYGVRLFDRNSKSVELTPAGRELLLHVNPLLQHFAEVRRAVLRAAGAISGPLAIGASLTIGEYVLPPVISAFARDYPSVEIHMTVDNTEQIVRLVLDGVVDLGLVEGPTTSGDLVEEVFLEDELVLITAPSHHWRGRQGIYSADLKAEPMVCREEGSGTRQVMEEHLASVGLHLTDLPVVTELGGAEAIKGAVEAGMGLSAISRWAIRKELQLGTLLAWPIRDLPLKRTFRIIHHRGHTLVPAAQGLLQRIQSTPWPDLQA